MTRTAETCHFSPGHCTNLAAGLGLEGADTPFLFPGLHFVCYGEGATWGIPD